MGIFQASSPEDWKEQVPSMRPKNSQSPPLDSSTWQTSFNNFLVCRSGTSFSIESCAVSTWSKMSFYILSTLSCVFFLFSMSITQFLKSRCEGETKPKAILGRWGNKIMQKMSCIFLEQIPKGLFEHIRLNSMQVLHLSILKVWFLKP
jgi:hypothetical protein